LPEVKLGVPHAGSTRVDEVHGVGSLQLVVVGIGPLRSDRNSAVLEPSGDEGEEAILVGLKPRVHLEVLVQEGIIALLRLHLGRDLTARGQVASHKLQRPGISC